VDGKAVGEARIARTMPFVYSGDEGVDVGMDNETPVTEEYRQGENKFTGKILKVTVEKGPPAS
jgi:arylsulfatase